MLTSSTSRSPALNPPSSVSPTAFGSCASSNASYRPSQSPRQASRQHIPSFAKRTPASPKPAKSASVWPLAAPISPRATVDAATQYSPPAKSSRSRSPHQPPEADSPVADTKSARKGKRRDSPALEDPEPTETPSAHAPKLQMILRDDGSQTTTTPLPVVPQSLGNTSPLKRARPPRPAVKMMPARYELCDVKDLVALISNMLMELVQFNDAIPLRDGRLTRFHSR
jgi:hypothetical protein